MNLPAKLHGSSMSPYHYLLVGMCFLIHLVDGFDLFLMGFALPYLSDLATSAEKGFVTSAAMVGMGIGAIFLGAAADRYGRRKIMIVALLVNTAGTLISAVAPDYVSLMLSRLLTGVGIGAIAVLAVIIVQEFSPAKRKNLNVAIAGTGYSIGGIIVGLVAAPLIQNFGSWRSFFFTGAGISALALVLAIVVIPESLDFLLGKRPAGFEQQARRTLGKLRIDQSDISYDTSRVPSEVPPATPGRHWGSLGQLLTRDLRERTLLVWVMYGGLISTIYFVTGWTPQLITTTSGSAALGGLVGTFLGVGGLLGAILFGLIGLKVDALKIVWVAIALSCIGMLAFASLISIPAGAFAVAVMVGTTLLTASTAAAGAAPPIYPALVRSGGFGAMMGVGRVGAILTPILAGIGLQYVAPSTLYFAAAAPLALAAVAALRLRVITSRQLLPQQDPIREVQLTAGN
ncbi:MFS transporter [Arthrobacter sp. MA-N2]|uniref:MFS transporter n=1 Tax=Arthrobacter sp. MA-N2 TaxID=1101188 RepID=UPI000480E010|nr:MFS transporter [Arthrobacter sp. MA-N2]